MVKVEEKGDIIYYPLIDKKEDITRYEPSITRKSLNGKQLLDFRLNVDNIDREKWRKIEEVMKEIFLEANSGNVVWTTATSGGLIFSTVPILNP